MIRFLHPLSQRCGSVRISSADAGKATGTTGRIDRRGVVAVSFAIGATALLGMAALATEAGVWLTARRNAQNAADAAAVAGVYSMALRGTNATGSNSVNNVARDVATRNGFTDGAARSTVTVEIGRWSAGTFTTPTPAGSSPNAVRVNITQAQYTGLSRLISRATPVAWGGAVAAVLQGGPACTLTVPPPNPNAQVAGRTNIAGSTTVNAPECLMVANATGRRSINIQNAASARAATIGGLRASGQCYNCADVMGGNMPAGYTSGAAPTDNPYAYVDRAPMPTFTGGSCVAPTYLDASGRPTTRNNNQNPPVEVRLTSVTGNASPTATCADIAVGSGNNQIPRLTLTPGTYYFNNASLSQTGGTIACSGCSIGGQGVTLVFTGSNANSVGNIRITGGEFDIRAPGAGFGSPAVYDGIAIYRDDLGRTSPSSTDSIKITGNPNSTLFGAIYAPTAHVEFEGTGAMNQTPTAGGGCLAVVAGEITYSGNSAININACEANGTRVTRISYVSLVQ